MNDISKRLESIFGPVVMARVKHKPTADDERQKALKQLTRDRYVGPYIADMLRTVGKL